MAHDHPEPQDGRILYDGCDECNQRAASIEGLHHLDPQRINALWDKMHALEFVRDEHTEDRLSQAELRACRVLYQVGVLIEHMSGQRMDFGRPTFTFDPSLIKD